MVAAVSLYWKSGVSPTRQGEGYICRKQDLFQGSAGSGNIFDPKDGAQLNTKRRLRNQRTFLRVPAGRALA